MLIKVLRQETVKNSFQLGLVVVNGINFLINVREKCVADQSNVALSIWGVQFERPQPAFL